MNLFNFGTTFCKRMNVKELVTNVPVYGIVSDGSAGGLSLMLKRWATKKTAGSTKNGRDSKPKNLGVKIFDGEMVILGNIITVGIVKDHNLYALKEGCVRFERHKLSGRKWVHVVPEDGHVLHPVYATTASPGSLIKVPCLY
ncbi:hypothetical protein RGQ29_009701 [Quercus rubra]|uniref:Uncharacterized protein n=1 Tax=Quercus rubra TaxID=3512 RepID=A0AAN7IZC8_QUERU|nr:hypothetical protein RGQ29_009701 [Quercus rubra]